MDVQDSRHITEAIRVRVGLRRQRRRRRKLLAIELMQDFANNTTLHGLRYATDRTLSLVEKLFWIITFLISLSLCICLMHNVWVKWQTSPVIVALSEHLVSVREVPFPSITVCPQIKSKRSVYNFSQETVRVRQFTENLTTDQINEDPSMNKFEDIGLICWIEQLIGSVSRNHSDAAVVQNIIEVSPNVSDIFRGCRVRNTQIRCNEIFAPVLTMEGVCFTTNSLAADEIFRSENIQKDYAYLNSTKRSEHWSYTDGYSRSDDDAYPRRGRDNSGEPDVSLILREMRSDRDGLCNGINSGYKVYLHHPADVPQSSLYYYAAMPKRTSSFALKFSVLNTSTSLSGYRPEIRQCYFPEERQLRYFRIYTSNNCRLECVSNYTFQLCGCVWFHMPHNDSSTICREGRRKCVTLALEEFAASTVDDCLCLPSCVGIQYEAEILKTKFDAHSYIDAVMNVFPEWFPDEKNSTTKDSLGTEILSQIELYYKEPRFVSMRRSELFGLTDFLANCGGLLGLFLGFSFLSLVEIFYFCTLRLGCTIRRDKELTDTYQKDNLSSFNPKQDKKEQNAKRF